MASGTARRIQAKLPPDTALVEFVRNQRFDARQKASWQEARYVAYLLTTHGSPQWVLLGNAPQSHPHFWAPFVAIGNWTALDPSMFSPPTPTP